MRPLRLAQRARLAWLRLAGPAQRTWVILRYEGYCALQNAVAVRLRPEASTQQVIALREGVHARPDRLEAAIGFGPAASVIVRTHNRPSLLRHALADLASQTFTDFEVIIVNDGEVPVEDLLVEFENKLRIRAAAHAAGSGRAAALNSGVRQASGDFLTYLDDDDRVEPDHLFVLVSGFREGIDLVYTRATQALCWLHEYEDHVLARNACISRPFDLQHMLIDNWIPFMTVMHRRECIARAGEFDAGLELFEDWDFLIRLGRCCHFEHVPEITCEYRYRFGEIPDRARSAVTARKRMLEATRLIYQRYPATDRETKARRQLTLNALERDVEEVAWIEATVRDPLLRDLRTVAWAGRFRNVTQYETELKRQLSKS
jgi:glycosyltransferase involved in cell wall biosynthesis